VENVDPSVGLDRARHGELHRGGPRNVRTRQGLAARAMDHRDRILGRLSIHVHHDHARPLSTGSAPPQGRYRPPRRSRSPPAHPVPRRLPSLAQSPVALRDELPPCLYRRAITADQPAQRAPPSALAPECPRAGNRLCLLLNRRPFDTITEGHVPWSICLGAIPPHKEGKGSDLVTPPGKEGLDGGGDYRIEWPSEG